MRIRRKKLILEFNQDEFNQGFNDCIKQWIINMQGGQNGGAGGGQPGMEWDNLEQPPSPPSDGKESGKESGNGGSSSSDSDIDNMSGKEAAKDAKESADKAKQTADKAQQKANQAKEQASQSGSAADQAAADAAQKAADDAQQAADQAQQAANDAQQAANAGNDQQAREKAKEARDAAKNAQSASNSGSAADNAQQSAKEAKQAANQAQQAANQAQNRAAQTGSAADKAAADAAQDSADKAKDAANKAQQAARKAQQAAQAGDNQGAYDNALEAQNAANEAKNAAQQAQAQNKPGSEKLGQREKAFKGKGSDNNNSSDNSSSEKQPGMGKVITVNVRKVWGGADRISKEKGMQISEAEGEPFDTDELNETPEERGKRIFEHVKPQIEGSHGEAGKNGLRALSSRLQEIERSLTPHIVNWRALLARLFKSAGVKDQTIYKMRKQRFGGSFDRADRFEEIKPKSSVRPSYDAADVFYLIDNSGSISREILLRTLSEVIALEKKVSKKNNLNILKSALTYFSIDIDESRIRVWYPSTSKHRILDMAIDQPGEMYGGTAIATSVVSVTKLSKKFYSKKNPSTLIIVFTDAEDSDWKGVKNLPDEIKKNLVFIVMNTYPYFDTYILKILAAGVPERNIVPIDINKLSE